MVGQHDQNIQQLDNFRIALSNVQGLKLGTPASWFEAFDMLTLKREIDVDVSIKKISAKYFSKHRDTLKNGILPVSEVEKVIFDDLS